MKNNIVFSVFTPTFNREESLSRVYESLCKQNFKNFEWIIVDDGSTDKTRDLVKKFKEKADFKIIYKYQDNAGKHNAINKGVELASGELFIIIDSDDAFLSNSLQILYSKWMCIDKKKRKKLKGITCRCISEEGKLIGNKEVPEPYIEISELDAKFRYGYTYEMWGAIRTEVMREFPFPNIKGIRFYPETVIWDRMARKYNTIYINDGLRIYYKDQDDATTNRKSFTRANENYYLWSHYLNENMDILLKYDKKLILKSMVGLVRDGIISGRKYGYILNNIKSISVRIMIIFTSPMAIILAKKCR